MKFYEPSKELINLIFQKIDESQNDRIIEQSKQSREILGFELDKYGPSLDYADINTQKYLLIQIKKLHDFAMKPDAFKDPGRFSFSKKSIIEGQNRFLYYLQQLPDIIKESAIPYDTCASDMFASKIHEVTTHIAIPLDIHAQWRGKDFQVQSDDITTQLLLKKLGESQLFNHVIQTNKIIKKIPGLANVITDKFQILLMQIDHLNKELILQLKSEKVSYRIEKETQYIYLDQGMRIIIDHQTYIEVLGCKFNRNKNEIMPNLSTPELVECNLKPIIKNCENMIMLQKTNALDMKELVEISMRQNTQLNLNEYFNLPNSPILGCDSCGYYITVNDDQFVQLRYDGTLKCNGEKMILGLMIEDQVTLYLGACLEPVWNGTELFDL